MAQRHRYVRSILRDRLNLDVGSGQHKITQRSIGLDLRRQERPEVVCSALALPFVDGSFDVCTMLEVFEHMDSGRQRIAIAEAHRILKKNGQFVISTPNLVYGLFNIVWWFWERTGGRRWYHEHVGMVRPEEIERMLESSQFAVHRSKRVAFFDRIIDTRCLKKQEELQTTRQRVTEVDWLFG